MGVKTITQGAIWKDSLALWSYEISLYGEDSPAVAYKNRGLARQEAGNFRDALSDFDVAIKIDPTHEGAFGNRGLAYQSMGRLTPALKDYDRAIVIDPNDKTAITTGVRPTGELGRFDEAIRDFNRAIEIDPALLSARNNLAKAYLLKGNREKAIFYYKEAAGFGSTSARDYLLRNKIK